jgi:AcrR family transcriptional regulator
VSGGELLFAAARGEAARTRKGEETRARILETALALFAERGYEGTTMRAIAESARLSLGSTYYYYRSKEHLIQGFYARSHDEHLAACEEVLATNAPLGERLSSVLEIRLRTLAPYHAFAAVLFRTAADPESPLNPWSAESRPVRAASIDLFARVVDGSSTRVPPSLRTALPELLWVYHMGIILFWVHDRSPGCERSHRLAQRTTELVARLVGLAGLPPLRPLVRATVGLLDELRT